MFMINQISHSQVGHFVFPLRYQSYILTKDMYVEATPRSPMFGLDCEMCRTTTGLLELTRISVVDEKMNVSTEYDHSDSMNCELLRFTGDLRRVC